MGRPKLSKFEIIQQVENLGLEFIEFIRYDGKQSEFLVRCGYNHKPYKTNLNTINKGRRAKGCPECKYYNKQQTNINKVGYNKVKEYCKIEGFDLITEENEYTGVDSMLTLLCKNNHIVTTSYANLKKRVIKCPHCYELNKINIAKNRAFELGYEITIDRYNNKHDKLDIICDNGHVWNPTYDSFINAESKCLFCQYSKGEDMIETFLLNHDILYEKQKQFDDCVYKRKLKFDFYLPLFNICIEFDGIQHFEPQDFFGGEESYNDLHLKDIIKDDYCNINNIDLLRISYLDYNDIESILKNKLNLL